VEQRTVKLLGFETDEIHHHYSLPEGYDFLDVTPENVYQVRTLEDRDFSDHLAYKVRQGHKGVFVIHEGQVVHRSFIVPGPGNVPIWFNSIHENISEDECLIHYCETMADYRKLGLYTATLHYLVKRTLKDWGFRRVKIFCETSNFASASGISKAGFQPFLKVTRESGREQPMRSYVDKDYYGLCQTAWRDRIA